MGKPRRPSQSTDLELLLDRIRCGTVEDLEELDAKDLELLREYCGSDEEVQALIDEFQGGQRD